MIGVSHPKHVLIFKNLVQSLIAEGNDVLVVAVDKDITLYLLSKFNIPYIVIGKNQKGLLRKLLYIPWWVYLTFKSAKRFKPDIFVGRAIPHIAYVSWLFKKPFIIFEDTEIATAVHKITFPFAKMIVTPSSYQDNLGEKHVKFKGFFEQCYLHTSYFEPDSSVLQELNIKENECIILVRFVSWNASHDINDSGFSNKIDLINSLINYGKVIISSEDKLPTELETYCFNLPYEKMHHLMFYSTLFLGESATMGAECAMLGVPSIFVSTSRRGYTDILESQYGLLYNFSGGSESQKFALEKAISILSDYQNSVEWKNKMKYMVDDTIDVNKFMVQLIQDVFRESFNDCSHK
ncbi:DUF354 domain-containing protein [Methanolobus sp. ZRKC5]